MIVLRETHWILLNHICSDVHVLIQVLFEFCWMKKFSLMWHGSVSSLIIALKLSMKCLYFTIHLHMLKDSLIKITKYTIIYIWYITYSYTAIINNIYNIFIYIYTERERNTHTTQCCFVSVFFFYFLIMVSILGSLNLKSQIISFADNYLL